MQPSRFKSVLLCGPSCHSGPSLRRKPPLKHKADLCCCCPSSLCPMHLHWVLPFTHRPNPVPAQWFISNSIFANAFLPSGHSAPSSPPTTNWAELMLPWLSSIFRTDNPFQIWTWSCNFSTLNLLVVFGYFRVQIYISKHHIGDTGRCPCVPTGSSDCQSMPTPISTAPALVQQPVGGQPFCMALWRSSELPLLRVVFHSTLRR